MIDEVDGMRAEDFARMLPQGWRVEIDVRGREKTVAATHVIYGRVHIGPKLRLVPADVQGMCERVREAEAPSLTYSQWQAAGIRHGYLRGVPDKPLPRMLRLLAICCERETVEARDVAQALFAPDAYTLTCPIAEASSFGHGVAELYALASDVAQSFGYWAADVNDAPFKDCTEVEVPSVQPSKVRVTVGGRETTPMTPRRLSFYCMEALMSVYYSRVRAGESFAVSDDEIDARGWQDFAPWHGEDYMYQAPDGRRYITNPDEPANAVDVTDVPLQYKDEMHE